MPVWAIASGSSPHTRGALSATRAAAGVPRIIPAYAGSTPRWPGSSAPGRDHPRIRGEHAEADGPHYFPVGSSPHTRGARCFAIDSSKEIRIIPAYAGSTPGRRGRVRHHGDHPRIRGEHDHARMVQATPRRIIPAYAGSTHASVEHSHRDGDHPRIRGEHVAWVVSCPLTFGSSPHTRGARRGDRRRPDRQRIIPAYAGSTPDVIAAATKAADHPRIRGEHWKARASSLYGSGSSPHTRGARHYQTTHRR